MNSLRFLRFLLPLLLIAVAQPGWAQQREDDREHREREEWHEEGEQSAREAYFYGTRAYPFERIPQNARLNALRYSEERIKPFGSGRSLQGVSQWKQIGPYDIGGRITSIAVHPTDGKTLWIAAADGGVWKSSDTGNTWAPVMDFENAITMGAIAVDPNNPDVLYAGTGEAAQNVDSYIGAGMLKSTDGGTTWRSAGLLNVAAFARVAVRPGNGNIVFAAAIKNNAGLYRSADAGRTWTRIIGTAVTDITINPANPDEMWIGGNQFGIMHSTDGGLTFVLATTGLGPGGNSFFGRVSVQVAPLQPTILYALIHELSSQGESRIYKSTNSGASWSLVLDNAPDLLTYYGHAQGEYNNVIAVSPIDPDIVIAGGVVLLRSTNGGASWTTFESQLHPDHHALAFDPLNPERLFVGNDGGMYRSENAGGAYRRISTELAITQFYAMAIDQTKANVTYGGTQDNGTISNEASDYWGGGPGIVGGGDGFYVVIDPQNPNIVYYEQPFGLIYRVDLPTNSRGLFIDGLVTSDPSDPAAWSAPLVQDPGDPTRMYHGRSRVYRWSPSTTWRALSPPFRTPISAIGVSTLDPRIIYAGSGAISGDGNLLLNDGIPLGELKVSTNGGTTWEDRSTGTGLPNRAITKLLPSANDTCTAYAAFSGFGAGHIFRTTDCGRNWTDISRGLPDIPVNALAVHPANESVIYAGTDIGVYITVDGGASWSSYNNGLPHVIVSDLAIHASSNTLRAATHGRSMWEIPLESPAPLPSVTAPAGREVWMGRTSQTIAWSGITGPARVEYSLDGGASWNDAGSSVAGTLLTWTTPDTASAHAVVRVTSQTNPSETAVSREFTLEKYRAGGVIVGALQPFGCWGLAYDGEVLWATIEDSDTLLKIDPVTLASVGLVKVDDGSTRRRFADITYHPRKGTLFYHDITGAPQDAPGGWLVEVTKQGTVLHRWPSPCWYPNGLAWIDDGADGYLLASEAFGAQNFYVINADSGTVIRTITPPRVIDFGPMGIAAGEGGTIWQVIDDFDIQTGPKGSSAVLLALDALEQRCSFDLAASPDSAIAGGYTGWGKFLARGIERDPHDGNLWITNLDGGIYKIAACTAQPSSVRAAHPERAVVATLEGIMPNPFSSGARVHFSLVRGARARIDLYDTEGRLALTVADSYFESGAHDLPLDPSSLSSGIYSCRLTLAGGLALSRSVVYVK